MISVREACDLLLAQVHPVGQSLLGIDQALHRVLAEDVASPIEFPFFDNSSMDGFAIIAADLAGATRDHPVSLPVVGDIPAGTIPEVELHQGQAMRIMTGAAVPAGADAIVPVEATDQPRGVDAANLPDRVVIYQPASRGDYIRPQGQDVHAGQMILKSGRRLLPQDIGVLAMCGIPRVMVYDLPRVALLSSGNELVPVEQPLSPGKIHDSNSYMLSGLLDQAKVEMITLGIARDDYSDLARRLDQAVASNADLIISTAGVSVGSFDYVRSVILDHGDLTFWQVNMRPGKPVAFGHYKGTPIIGLPGNPASAFVGFEVFVGPVLARMKGLPQGSRSEINVMLDEAIESDGRESYLRAIVAEYDGNFHARLTGHQGSGNLLSIVLANALLIVPSGVKSLPAGTTLKAWLWNQTL